MGEFFPSEPIMADEAPKTEPIPIVTDAPSIAAGDQAPATEAARPETTEAPAAEAAKPETAEAPTIELPDQSKTEATIEPTIEAPTLPPAPKLAEPNAIIPFRRPEPKSETAAPAPSRSTRFALLAACVAIAASFGAIGGSLGVAKFGPMLSPPPAPIVVAAPVTKENVADEVKALKDTVVQLRTATRTLSENLAALKTSVNTSNNAQNAQIGKIADTLERVEKGQADQRKTIAAAAAAATAAPANTAHAAQQDITGSIAKPATTDPKNAIVPGWVLRRVYDGAALIEGRDGIIEVEPGDVAPGLGRIEGIKRQDGRWVVVTARGVIVGR
jgi:hypothetical protein